MKKILLICSVILIGFGAINSQASTLDFNDPNHLGVTRSDSMQWIDGHLYLDNTSNYGEIFLDTPSIVRSYQISGSPYDGYSYPMNIGGWYGKTDLYFYDATGTLLWHDWIVIGLNQTWSTVETGQTTNPVSYIQLYKSWQSSSWYSGQSPIEFMPSIDNISSSDQQTVPEPATMLLLGLGLVGLAGMRRRIRV